MAWLKCYKNVDRSDVNQILNLCESYGGIVSIYTTKQDDSIMLVFNKFHGVDDEIYIKKVGYIMAVFRINAYVKDFKIDALTV